MTIPATGILFYEPRAKPLSTIGLIQPGCYYQFYLTGTTTQSNVYSDGTLSSVVSQTPVTGGTTAASDGRLIPLYLDPSITYRVQLYSSLGVLIEDVDPYIPGGTPNQATIAKLIYPQTSAELAATVTPTNYLYPPGDLRRYGAVAGTDVTSALSAAAAQSQQANAAPIYIPSALGTSSTVTAGVTLSSRPVKILGDGYSVSGLTTSSDITIFSFTLGSSGSEIAGIQLTGEGSAATNPAILFTNSNFNQVARCYIHSFGVGVRYVPGSNSSYLNTIRDSQIVQNLLINIDAQALTNALQIYATTLGGGNTAVGLKVVDSSNLLVSGFDCEGCKTVGIDIDNPTIPNLGGHVIQGGDIEGATSTFSAGAIRLGGSNVHPVLGVLISGINSASGGSDDSFLNAVNCGAVDVRNVFINSGFAGTGLTDGWLKIGANAKNITTGNVTNVSSTTESLVMPFGIVCDSHSPYTGSATTLVNGGLITTSNLVVIRVAPASAVVGIVLQSGTRPGQRCVVINESAGANTITFAAAGTSAVADGTSDQIPGLTAREFVWSNVTGLWYKKG